MEGKCGCVKDTKLSFCSPRLSPDLSPRAVSDGDEVHPPSLY